MDGFTGTLAPPPEYKEVKWLSDFFVFWMGALWLLHYVEMVYVSIKDRTYCLNILALCCDFAWEITYTMVYPSANLFELVSITCGLLVNLFVMYTAVQAAPSEWQHQPLVAQNIRLIFVGGTVLWLWGHNAITVQLGRGVAYTVTAIPCQLLITVGQICQLLSRNSTRGASLTLWLSRSFGSLCTLGFVTVRYIYWPEAFGWVFGPIATWSILGWMICECVYGYCYYCISRQEAAIQGSEHKWK